MQNDAFLNEPDSDDSADLQQRTGKDDQLPCSEVPRPVFARLCLQEMMRPQGRTTGINAVIGAWPGDETDEEIFKMLEEMS